MCQYFSAAQMQQFIRTQMKGQALFMLSVREHFVLFSIKFTYNSSPRDGYSFSNDNSIAVVTLFKEHQLLL